MEHDIVMLQAKIMDSILIGDAIAANTTNVPIIAKLAKDNEELETKKTILLKDIDKMRKIMDRSNRDFTDVKDSLPEREPKRILRVLEDYTLAVLVVSYLFAILAALYTYVFFAEAKSPAILKGVLGSSILTIFLYMVLFYLT